MNENIYNNIVNNKGSILHIPENKLNNEQVIRLRFLKEKYLTMWEIPQKAFLELAAQRQVFIDQSQSTNIYIAQPTKELLIYWKDKQDATLIKLRNTLIEIGQQAAVDVIDKYCQ